MKIITRILDKMTDVKRNVKVFVSKVTKAILTTQGKINFKNMSRYSDINEKTISRNYKKENYLKIRKMNEIGISEVYQKENKNMIATDCSFIKKSGKNTYGLGKFWDGKNSKTRKGLEISLLALVDTTYNTAYSINAVQTPSELKDTESRMVYYLKQLEDNTEYFEDVKYVAGDGLYSKEGFVNGVIKLKKHFIGKLRCDANLNYIYEGKKTGKKGAPRKYDGKVFFNCHKFEHVKNLSEEVKLYTAIVYSVFLKRKIRIAFLVNKENKHHIFFSTDTNLSTLDILDYYSSRFQIEFLFRDSKMYTGLEDCQSTNKNVLDSHFNMSLFTLNLAKIEDRILKGEENKLPFSMLNYKRVSSNIRMLNLFIHKFDINLSSEKMILAYNEMIKIGTVAC